VSESGECEVRILVSFGDLGGVKRGRQRSDGRVTDPVSDLMRWREHIHTHLDGKSAARNGKFDVYITTAPRDG
jgi:hypothetical protein